jgi:toxin ParE1/3/4
MKVRYLPRAVDDLAAIADYIAERNPSAALTVEAKIRATIQLLSEHPKVGRALEQCPTVRVMPVVRYPYLVFYEDAEDELFDTAHSARCPFTLGP